jgi:hypothetical protein
MTAQGFRVASLVELSEELELLLELDANKPVIKQKLWKTYVYYIAELELLLELDVLFQWEKYQYSVLFEISAFLYHLCSNNCQQTMNGISMLIQSHNIFFSVIACWVI